MRCTTMAETVAHLKDHPQDREKLTRYFESEEQGLE
jgi:hypothetical protein